MTSPTRRAGRLTLTAATLATLTLTGCGPSTSSSATGGAQDPAAASGAPTASAPAAADSSSPMQAASDCPTQNTRAFAKTRLVADLGLTAGTFHRYIYKPFKEGAFNAGAKGRTLALVKAGATAAADTKLLTNAAENIKANPTLCSALFGPMTELAGHLAALKGEITSGNVGSIASVESLVSGLLATATSNGLAVKETTNGAGA